MSRKVDLQTFAETWLQRGLTEADAIEIPDLLILPTALRDIYETFGAVASLTEAHNQLLTPESIETVDGHSIFYDENQMVVRWAYRIEDREKDDPIVYQGTTLDSGYEWHSEEMPLSEWIRVMTLWQLANGGYPFGAYTSGVPDGAGVVDARYPFVGGHGDSSTRFYGVPGQLVCLAGSATVPSVWAGGATTDDLVALSDALGFDWDYSALDDA
jgi:hypothetical protein